MVNKTPEKADNCQLHYTYQNILTPPSTPELSSIRVALRAAA